MIAHTVFILSFLVAVVVMNIAIQINEKRGYKDENDDNVKFSIISYWLPNSLHTEPKLIFVVYKIKPILLLYETNYNKTDYFLETQK